MWLVLKNIRSCAPKKLKHARCLCLKSPKRNVLFFGTDDFALTHLIALSKLKMQSGTVLDKLAVVVSHKKCPVGKFAVKAGIESHMWPVSKIPDYDLGVVVSFGHLIPQSVIEQFKCGMVNVHPSLLPKWRGAAPIIHTILSGESTSGVSIMKIQPKKFDCGPIVMQQTVPIFGTPDLSELRANLAGVGAQMLLDVILNLEKTFENSTEQNSSSATYAKKVKVNNAQVDWENTMQQIDRQYRALGPVFNLRSQYKDQAVRLLDMMPICDMKSDTIPIIEDQLAENRVVLPGYVLYLKKQELLCIKCKDGWLGFNSVLIKKTMSAKAFYNGYLSKPGNKHSAFTSLNNGLDKYTYWTANTGYS